MIINELSPDMIKSLQIAIKFYGYKLKLIVSSLEFSYKVKLRIDVLKQYINSLTKNEKRMYQEKDNEEKRFLLNLAKQYYFQPEILLSKYQEEYSRDRIRRQDIRQLLQSTFNLLMVQVYNKKNYILKDSVYEFIFMFMSWPVLFYEDIQLKSILQDLFDIADYYLQFNNRKQTRQNILSAFGQHKLQTIIQSLIYIDKIIDIYIQETTNQIILESGYIEIIKSKTQYSYFQQQILRYFNLLNNTPFNQQDMKTHLSRYIFDSNYHYIDNFFNELDEEQSFQIFYNIFIHQINLNIKRKLQLSPLGLKQIKLNYMKVNNLKKLIKDAGFLQLQSQFLYEVYRSLMNFQQTIDKQKLKVILELYLDL